MNDVIEYHVHMSQLLHFGGLYVAMLDELPLEKMARSVQHASNFGHVVDPTAYRTALGDGRLEKQRAAIDAARAFVRAWREAGLPEPRE